MSQRHEVFANVLLERMRNSGLDVPHVIRDVPPIRDAWTQPSQNGHSHPCGHGHYIDLPVALIVDVKVPNISDVLPRAGSSSPTWRARERFTPYWLVNVRVLHDWAPYLPEPFGTANPIEAACILGQEPHIGSIMSHLGFHVWGHQRVQAYRCPERGGKMVIGSCKGMGHNHHTVMYEYALRADTNEILHD